MSQSLLPGANLSTGPVRTEESAAFANRIDVLYRLCRHHLYVPFSALCLACVFYTRAVAPWLAIIPFLLQIAATVGTGRLADAYARHAGDRSVESWATRFTIASGAAGAAWGVGAVVWFIPHYFPAQAFLALAFLGMTAAEFITRSAYRPAYLAHAVFSLGPLALSLLFEGNVFALLSSALVVFFAGVLLSYCEDVASVLDEALQLKLANAGLVQDLSVEKREAERARDVAEASMRARSDFVANIGHEIRSPLSALLGMAQMLERSGLDRAQKNHARVLLEAGRGLKTLLDDLVAFSVEGDGAEVVSEKACDVAQEARTVVRLLKARAWEKQLRLAVNAAADLPHAAADPRRVRQVLLKLADNALKFTDRGGIEIGVETGSDSMLKVTVADTGTGVPADIGTRIFGKPRGQASAGGFDGRGLGLAVAKRVVTSLGGSIGFENEPVGGARFWFTLPVIPGEIADRDELVAVAGEAAPPWGLVVLACLDTKSDREQLAHMLEPFGNRLEFATDAEAVAALTASENFDVAIVLADHAGLLDGDASASSIPRLSLVASSAQVPVDFRDSLIWPCGAAALYAALRGMLGRAADAGGQTEDAAPNSIAIDAVTFAALEKSLGISVLVEILESYIGTAEQLIRQLETASKAADWPNASRIAQDIAGSAGGLGLVALTEAARSFSRRARDGATAEDLKESARMIAIEHNRVCRALANLYPELAAA